MRLRVDRQEFTDAIAWATRVAGSRAALPALTGVLLEAGDGRLVCRATDLEISAEIGVPAHVEKPGRTLLAARFLAQLVARFPDAEVHLEDDGDRVQITCGRAKFRVRRLQADDFPAMPPVDEDAPRGTVKSDALARLVSQVGRAAAVGDDARAVLTGVNLEAAGGRLTAAATDTYRLAARSLAFEQAVEGEAIVPARALQEVARAAGEVGGEVTIVLGTGQISFLIHSDRGDRTLTSRLVEGPFPNYRSLLPDSSEVTVVVDRAALTEALQRVAVVASAQTNTPVLLAFSSDGVEIQASNQEAGDASEQLAAEVEGGPLEIAFNPAYLLAGLEATGTPQVRFELRDGLRAAVIRPHAEDGKVDDLTYLLMPMRVS
jgi:DNA polymerase-3 subunit beta